jgi:hypothetical protein
MIEKACPEAVGERSLAGLPSTFIKWLLTHRNASQWLLLARQ